MKKGNFLITHSDGRQSVHSFKLENNMSFAPIEACKWLKQKYSTAIKVTSLAKK